MYGNDLHINSGQQCGQWRSVEVLFGGVDPHCKLRKDEEVLWLFPQVRTYSWSSTNGVIMGHGRQISLYNLYILLASVCLFAMALICLEGITYIQVKLVLPLLSWRYIIQLPEIDSLIFSYIFSAQHGTWCRLRNLCEKIVMDAIVWSFHTRQATDFPTSSAAAATAQG